MPNKNQRHIKVGRCVDYQKKLMIPSPIHKNVGYSRVKLTPVSKMSQCSSKIMDQDTKKIKPVIYHKEQSIVPSNLKISKEVTITKVNNTENDIILKLKKLPGITIDLVRPEPVFKVPEIPKLKTKNNNKKKNIATQTEVFFKKKGLSVRRYDNIKDKNNLSSRNIINKKTNLNPSKTLPQKQEQTFNNIPLVTKSSDKDILNNPKVSFKIYPVSEKENVQRTSYLKEHSKKIQSSSKTKLKNPKSIKLAEVSNNCKIFTKGVKPTEKVSNNNSYISSKEVTTISNKDTFKNDIQFKTNEPDKDNYKLMNSSTDGQINIVPAYFPLNFISDSSLDYDNFFRGISKSSEGRSSVLETSQNDTEKRSIINKSEFQGCANTSLNINETDDIYSKLAFQSFNNGNLLDNMKDKQWPTKNKSKESMIGKFKDELNYNSNFYFYNHTSKQPSLQYYNNNHMMDTCIEEEEEKQPLQNMTSYCCDNSIENMPKNENNLMDLNIPILPNIIKNSSNLNSDENENDIKRKQSTNDLSIYEKLKKQKYEMLNFLMNN